VIGQFIKLVDALNVRANDGLLLFENSDVSIYLCIAKLIVVEVSQSSWDL
jgi:hypothetical protein